MRGQNEVEFYQESNGHVGLAGPLHSTPLQIISLSIPRLDPIDSKSSLKLKNGDWLVNPGLEKVYFFLDSVNFQIVIHLPL